MMLEEIFDIAQTNLPTVSFDLKIIRHERIREGAIGVLCTVNNLPAQRIIQLIYGNTPGISSSWLIDERAVNNYYSSILENLYESQIAGEVILVR